jgi:putative component of membrane protein insertase Oxa1/YidC/SpoIIIJ protein YidD
MSILLLCIIRFYRRFVKPVYPKTCLYKESCSVHVERITQHAGFIAGIKALQTRVSNCQQGYHLFDDNGEIQLITRTRRIVPFDEINPELLRNYSKT